MRKSCVVQLAIFIVILVVLGMSLRRYAAPAETLQPPAVPGSPTVSPQQAAPQQGSLGTLMDNLLPARSAQEQDARQLAVAPNLSPTLPNSGIEGLTLRLSQPLMIKAPRVQGLAADARFLYVATSDPATRTATLYKLNRDTGTIAQVRNIQRDGKYALGGIHVGAGLLWAPMTDPDQAGSTLILGIDPQYLETRRSFEATDYIAAVAQDESGRLYGVNDGATLFYEWSAEGRLLRQVPNANEARYQDMEVVLGSLVCAGQHRDGGVLDVIDPGDLSLLARHRCYTRLDDGSYVTHKGFAYAEETFIFLPEEGDFPRAMSYVLNGQLLDRYIPSVKPPS